MRFYIMGKLIVIEGLDGSGKKTQSKILSQNLNNNFYGSKCISFPDYNQDSSALVKMYLNSEFGSNPSDVNAYAASSFYAVDRFASYKKTWQKDYQAGKIIIADRYTTSNAIYQLTKICKSDWDNYLSWLYEYEYKKLELPIPNKVIYLKIPIDQSQKLIENRYHGDVSKKDLHENNINFLKKCQDTAKYVSEKYDWHVIDCFSDGEIKNKTEISKQILDIVQKEVL